MPVNLRALVSDPEFQNFPIQDRLTALQKAGAPQEFIDGYRKIDFNKAHENNWPAPIDVPPDTGKLPDISVANTGKGILNGIGGRLSDMMTGPFKDLQNDFETDAKNWGPVAGPLKTIATKTTFPLQIADQTVKGLTNGATQAKSYYDQGKLGKAIASVMPVVGNTVPAIDKMQQGYSEDDANKIGQGFGSALTDGAMLAAPFIEQKPSFLPQSATDFNIAKGVGKGIGTVASLPLTGTGSLIKMLAGPMVREIFGATGKGEAPIPKVDVNPESIQGPPTANTLAEQAYKDSTPKGSKVKAIEQGLKAGRPIEDLLSEVMAPKEKPIKPTKISAADAKALKRKEDGFVPPPQQLSITPGELPGVSSNTTMADSMSGLTPNPKPAMTLSGSEPQGGTAPDITMDDLLKQIQPNPNPAARATSGTEPLAGTNTSASWIDALNRKMAELPTPPPEPGLIEADSGPQSESILSPEPPPSIGIKGMTAPEVTAGANAAGIRAQIDKLLSDNPQGLNARGQAVLDNLKRELAQYEAKRTARAVLPGIRRR